MELFAAGFNAWGQLDFGCPSDTQTEPEDVNSFRVVLEGDNITCPVSKLSFTLVTKDKTLKRAGSGLSPEDVESYLQVGTAQNALGEILHNESGTGQLSKFENSSAYRSKTRSKSWPFEKPVKEIVAFEAGWVILHADGTVATLGDPRYGDCLGRETKSDRPASSPHEVEDLANLDDPVVKVAAGGYTATALTKSGSVYAWGMRSPGTHWQQGIPNLNGVPNYIDIGDNSDIEDIGVGESHAIALTTEGTVWVIGGNTNGQLGLGLGYAKRVDVWTKVDLGLPEGRRAIRVAAGPRASFITVADTPNKT